MEYSADSRQQAAEEPESEDRCDDRVLCRTTTPSALRQTGHAPARLRSERAAAIPPSLATTWNAREARHPGARRARGRPGLAQDPAHRHLARSAGPGEPAVRGHRRVPARARSRVAQRGQDKHLHYSRGVTVEEMRQASMALMQLVPTKPAAGPKGRDRGRGGRGRDRDSDEEPAAATRP